MPELSSKIAIGFGLEGYTIKSTKETSGGVALSGGGGGEYSGSSGGGYGGVNVGWSDAELDEDRWLKDTSLKQLVVQTTIFQSCPLKYTNDSGQVEYINFVDGVDEYDQLGGTAYGTSIGGMIDSSLSRLKKWESALKTAGKTDFDMGCGICPRTLIDYLNHFYNLNLDMKSIAPICRIMNVEMLCNTGGASGKAFRLKVVDSSGPNNGCKNTNNVQGQHYQYDVIDINTAILLTSNLSEVVKLADVNGKGPINGGKYEFPWKDAVYDYKTGTIPGYSPTAILGFSNQKFETGSDLGSYKHGVIPKYLNFSSNAHTKGGIAIARARFFIDEKDRAKAQQLIPNCPDELFKTNYSVGESITIQSSGSVKVDDPLIQSYIDKPIVISSVPYKLTTLPSKATVQTERSVYGAAGSASYVTVNVPDNYPLKLYDGGQRVTKISGVHPLAADRLEALFRDVANHYAPDMEKVAPRICRWFGYYNKRQETGSSKQSIHGYGIAFDIDANNNPYRKPSANMPLRTEPIYGPFFEIAKAHGWRQHPNDGMHFELTI